MSLALATASSLGSSMKTVTMHKAKTHLSQPIAEAEAGEEVIITRDRVPAVRLVPVGEAKPVRQFGSLKGQVQVTAAFFEPLSPGRDTVTVVPVAAGPALDDPVEASQQRDVLVL